MFLLKAILIHHSFIPAHFTLFNKYLLNCWIMGGFLLGDSGE